MRTILVCLLLALAWPQMALAAIQAPLGNAIAAVLSDDPQDGVTACLKEGELVISRGGTIDAVSTTDDDLWRCLSAADNTWAVISGSSGTGNVRQAGAGLFCANETGGVTDEQCHELDSNSLFVCETGPCEASGWVAYAGGGGGEINDAVNVGTSGVGIFSEKVGLDLRFAKLVEGTNCTFGTDGPPVTQITISCPDLNTQLSQETVEDFVGALIGTQVGIAVTYVDNGASPGTITYTAEVTQAELDGHTGSATAHHTLPTAGTLTGTDAGTDLTANLEEETHASEHAENALDELLVEGLGTACALGQRAVSDGAGGVDCADAVRFEANCVTAVGGVPGERCFATTINAGIYRCPTPGDCSDTTPWTRIDDNTGGSPSGAAGGGLTGTYPNPGVANDGHSHGDTTIDGLNASAVTAGTFANGQISQSSVTQHEAALLVEGQSTACADGFGVTALTGGMDCADPILEGELNSESLLEGQLDGVSDVFTNNDGALDDDSLGNDDFTALQDVVCGTPAQGQIMYRNGTSQWICLPPGTANDFLKTQGTGADPIWATAPGAGTVSGPGSSTDTAFPRWNGAGGDTIQDGQTTEDAGGNVSVAGNLSVAGTIDSADQDATSGGNRWRVLQNDDGVTSRTCGTHGSANHFTLLDIDNGAPLDFVVCEGLTQIFNLSEVSGLDIYTADDQVLVSTGVGAATALVLPATCTSGTQSMHWNGAAFVCDNITGGSASDSFKTWDLPTGTDPVASLSTDTITVTAGEGIDINGPGAKAMDVACEDASASNKGCANFPAADFGITAGAVSIVAGMTRDTELAALINNTGRANDLCKVLEIDTAKDREKVWCTQYDGSFDDAGLDGEAESPSLTNGHFEAWRTNCTGGPPFTSCEFEITGFYMHEITESNDQGSTINTFLTQAADIREEWVEDGGSAAVALHVYMPSNSDINVHGDDPIWVVAGDPDDTTIKRTVGQTEDNIVPAILAANTDIHWEWGGAQMRFSTVGGGSVIREDGVGTGAPEVTVEEGDVDIVFTAGNALGWHVGNILCFGVPPHNAWADCGVVDFVPSPTTTNVTIHKPATDSMETNELEWTLYQSRTMVVEIADMRIKDIILRTSDAMAPKILDDNNLGLSGLTSYVIASTCDGPGDAGDDTGATCCTAAGVGVNCDPTRDTPHVYASLLGANSGFASACDGLGPLIHDWDFWVYAGSLDGSSSPRSANSQLVSCRLRPSTFAGPANNDNCVLLDDPYDCCTGLNAGTCGAADNDTNQKAMWTAQKVSDGASYLVTTNAAKWDSDMYGHGSRLRFITFGNNVSWKYFDGKGIAPEDVVQFVRSYGWTWGTLANWSQENDLNCFASGGNCIPDDLPFIEIIGRPMNRVAGFSGGPDSNDTVATTQGDMLRIITDLSGTSTDPTGHDFVQTTAGPVSDGTLEEQDVLNIVIEGQLRNFDTVFDVPDASTVMVSGHLFTDNLGATFPASTNIVQTGLFVDGAIQGNQAGQLGADLSSTGNTLFTDEAGGLLILESSTGTFPERLIIDLGASTNNLVNVTSTSGVDTIDFGSIGLQQAGVDVGDVKGVGTCLVGDCFVDGAADADLIFEGAADDDFETTFGVTDPTVGDQSYRTPDAAGAFSGFLAADPAQVTDIDGAGLGILSGVLGTSLGEANSLSAFANLSSLGDQGIGVDLAPPVGALDGQPVFGAKASSTLHYFATVREFPADGVGTLLLGHNDTNNDFDWFNPATQTLTLTEKTLNAESSGNDITLPFEEWYDFAGCPDGTTAVLNWDTEASMLAPATTCRDNGSTTQATADFNDSTADEGFQRIIKLPKDWTGAIDLDIVWYAPQTTGGVVWGVETACTAIDDTETWDGTFNTAQLDRVAPGSSANELVSTAFASITTTGCAADELMHLRIYRDADNTTTETNGDDMTGDAIGVGVAVTIRRLM